MTYFVRYKYINKIIDIEPIFITLYKNSSTIITFSEKVINIEGLKKRLSEEIGKEVVEIIEMNNVS